MEKNYVKELYRVFNDLPPYKITKSYVTTNNFTLSPLERQALPFVETPIMVEDVGVEPTDPIP